MISLSKPEDSGTKTVVQDLVKVLRTHNLSGVDSLVCAGCFTAALITALELDDTVVSAFQAAILTTIEDLRREQKLSRN